MGSSNGAKIGIAASGRNTGKSGGGLRNQSADNTKKMITGYKEKSEYISKNGVTSTVYLMDCMEGMRGYADNHFDLAVVDPPYGLGMRTVDGGSKKNTQTKFIDDLKKKRWDNDVPTQSYWDELFRVSRNQVVWGGNYFGLPAHRTFIVWDKMTYVPTMSQIEQAWTSFDSPARLIKINSNQPDRTHPTQKPVKLYDWIFANYAKPTDTILDTHLGSGSSRIAADRAGLNFIGFELDADYYHAQEKRFKNHVSQLTLF